LDLVKSLEDGGCSGPECPSNNVSAFLERIESANPNAPDLLEDDMNGNWGHYQFTAGSMRCATVLQFWDEIGTSTACKLFAAALKTCKVARFVCFTRGIEVGSYLSDAYLQTLVESLWAARQKAMRSIDSSNAQVCNINFEIVPISLFLILCGVVNIGCNIYHYTVTNRLQFLHPLSSFHFSRHSAPGDSSWNTDPGPYFSTCSVHSRPGPSAWEQWPTWYVTGMSV
jgi:hypothetical protein